MPTRRALAPRVDFEHRDSTATGWFQIVAQAEEEAAIRLLLKDSRDPELACRWAGEWVERLTGTRRRRARLQARRLLALCLAAAERSDDAAHEVALVLRTCDDAGMVRFAADGGGGIAEVVDAARSAAGGHL